MEETIGVLRGVSGHTYDMIYDLFFTTERVIACIVSHPQDVYGKLNLGQLLLGDFLSRRQKHLQQIDRIEQRRQSFEGQSHEGLLALHPTNFALNFSDLARVEVKKGRWGATVRFYSATPSGERVFNFGLKRQQVEDALRIIEHLPQGGVKS